MQLGEIRIEVDEAQETVTSLWPDGTYLVAKPVYDQESIARARKLGYGGSDRDAVWAMTCDHDPTHHLVAQAEGHRWSWHLYWVAIEQSGIGGDFEKEMPDTDGDREERLVFLMQRTYNVGPEGVLGCAAG